MNLRQLESLIAVADQGSFSAAAQELLTVQSNVSTRIAALERELKVTLIDRGTRDVTPEGAVVVARARAVLANVAEIPTDLASLQNRIVGKAQIGFIGSTARWMVPLLLNYVEIHLPDVELRITEAATNVLEGMVAAADLDIAVVNLPASNADLSSQTLFSEDIFLVLPPGHHLAAAEDLSVKDLADVEFMAPAKGSSYRVALDNSFTAAGLEMRVSNAFEGIRLIESLAASGVAAALLPASATPTQHSPPPRKVEGIQTRQVGTLINRAHHVPAAVEAVLSGLHSIVAENIDDLRGITVPSHSAP